MVNEGYFSILDSDLGVRGIESRVVLYVALLNSWCMSRSRLSRSERVSDEVDVTYKIEMPFEGRSSKICLIDRGDEIEVVVAQVPVPAWYHINSNNRRGDVETEKKHSVSRWILEDAARVLDQYDWKDSSSRSANGNYYLRDVYFTCDFEDVDDAVMDAKKFLTDLEEKVLHHSRRIDSSLQEPPSELLEPK